MLLFCYFVFLLFLYHFACTFYEIRYVLCTPPINIIMCACFSQSVWFTSECRRTAIYHWLANALGLWTITNGEYITVFSIIRTEHECHRPTIVTIQLEINHNATKMSVSVKLSQNSKRLSSWECTRESQSWQKEIADAIGFDNSHSRQTHTHATDEPHCAEYSSRWWHFVSANSTGNWRQKRSLISFRLDAG